MKDRQCINAICAGLPGAENSDPWKNAKGGPVIVDGKPSHHDVWKVGGKIFASLGSKTPGVSIKTKSAETAQMLIEAGVGRKARYFHRSWVNLPYETEEDELIFRINNSYQIIRSSLPKKIQTSLPAFQGQIS